jgi:hypothetical protein
MKRYFSFGLVDVAVNTTVCKGKILIKNKKIIALDIV